MAMEGGPPGTEMTSISFRDQLWLNTFPLDRNLVFDYFALSPFYDRSCNNEQLRMQSVHPLDLSHLSKMTGMEYMLHEVQEPHLFVIRKQKRETPEKVVAISAFYVLDGSIYQAPNLHNVIGSRVMRAVYHISKAFSEAAAKLEKIGYDQESESTKSESKVGDEHKKAMETFDMKEVYRIDQILSAIQRKLPPAPLPPPIMAVNAEATSLASDSGAQYQAPQQQQTTPAVTENTVIVAAPQQGPPKRMKTER